MEKKHLLEMSVSNFISSPWNKIIVYTLTNEQINELLEHPAITKKEHRFPKEYLYEEHQHSEPQLILVIQGTLTHVANGRDYTQHRNDLLVVPANLPHHAYIGEKEELIVYAFNKK